jgi:hypothetical protein
MPMKRVTIKYIIIHTITEIVIERGLCCSNSHFLIVIFFHLLVSQDSSKYKKTNTIIDPIKGTAKSLLCKRLLMKKYIVAPRLATNDSGSQSPILDS